MRIAAAGAVTASAIAAFLVTAVDREPLAEEEAASAAVVRGPAVLVAHPAWAVAAAVEAVVVDGGAKEKSAEDEL